MTIETRHIVDLADIVSVRLECGKCGAATSLPRNTANEQLPARCANCGTPWFLSETSDKNKAEALISIVKHLAAMPHEQPWRIRLEIDASKMGVGRAAIAGERA